MKKIAFSDRYELTQAVDVLMGKIPTCPQSIVDSLWLKSRVKVGEVVAVAQSYESLGMNPETALNDKDGIGFYTKIKFAPGWKNKMFVRVDLLPHHIRITDIRIERLQSISEDDCLKEGVELFETHSTNSGKAYTFPGVNESYITPREAFAALIDKVSIKGTWDSNPYVFVYEFELID